jgi:diadenylate cyclase
VNSELKIWPRKGTAETLLCVARAASVDAIVCVTERVALLESLRAEESLLPLIPVAPSRRIQRQLLDQQFDALLLPLGVPHGCHQIDLAIAAALRARRLSPGDSIAFALEGDQRDGGLFIGLLEVRPVTTLSSVRQDLSGFVESIEPPALDAAIETAARIGRGQRRGRCTGTMMTIGDSANVMIGSVQLIPNPLQGHSAKVRSLLSLETQDMLIELSKLDGAFVFCGDGFIETAGAYLAPGETFVSVPTGLGTRHVTAAAVTARTNALAIVVSATDGNLRLFSRGRIAAEIDPDTLLPMRSGTSTRMPTRHATDEY